MAGQQGDEDWSIEDLVGGLDETAARRLSAIAAASHEDVMRAVRPAAAGEGERLAVLKAAVDDGLRTRRHLDYWGSSGWAGDAAAVVDALAGEVATESSAELVVLLQRGAGHLVKVILRADDSDGMIGDLASRVLELHRVACAAGAAEPRALAKWMVRFSFEEQDFFEIDPVAYVDALGETGLAVYRREVAKRSDPADAPDNQSGRLSDMYAGFPSFAAKYAAERLAIIDRDVDRLVELLGRDLSSPHQFTRVDEAMVELGRTHDALAWARRGIAQTTGWQVATLYDLTADLLAEQGDLGGVVELRRHHHERMPSASTHAVLQTAARANDTWDAVVLPARGLLAERDPAGMIDVLLVDGEPDEAWDVATEGGARCRRRSGCDSPRLANQLLLGMPWRCTCASRTEYSNGLTSAPTATSTASTASRSSPRGTPPSTSSPRKYRWCVRDADARPGRRVARCRFPARSHWSQPAALHRRVPGPRRGYRGARGLRASQLGQPVS